MECKTSSFQHHNVVPSLNLKLLKAIKEISNQQPPKMEYHGKRYMPNYLYIHWFHVKFGGGSCWSVELDYSIVSNRDFWMSKRNWTLKLLYYRLFQHKFKLLGGEPNTSIGNGEVNATAACSRKTKKKWKKNLKKERRPFGGDDESSECDSLRDSEYDFSEEEDLQKYIGEGLVVGGHMLQNSLGYLKTLMKMCRTLMIAWKCQNSHLREFHRNSDSSDAEGGMGKKYKKFVRFRPAIDMNNPQFELGMLFETDTGEDQFERLYVCLGPCGKWFLEGCRPVIGLDGYHLRGSYKGVLLTAVGIDPNNQLYLVVLCAVVEIKNKCTWKWFLTGLKQDLGIKNESN
ncbi:hypothetical protein ACH5RR_025812 [Cinchona calisaya]|uniref:MULE transposase domain-containing protein n=1 Tax=Cinchona calisaya TaxID=153742 RepID=A0ABD2Z0Q3_9GENT